MREIKFKAWDKVKREWFKSIHFIPEGVELSEATVSANVLHLMAQAPFEVMCEKYEFCQFAGLLDKNGKEIYEGDIYKTKSPKKYMVMFEEGAFVGGESEGNCIPLGWKCDDEGLAKEDDMGWLEVIGNVYENPELVHNSQK